MRASTCKPGYIGSATAHCMRYGEIRYKAYKIGQARIEYEIEVDVKRADWEEIRFKMDAQRSIGNFDNKYMVKTVGVSL